MTRALQRVIDRATVARALARGVGVHAEELALRPHLPVFTSDGTRVGDPRALRLDWSGLPTEYLLAPGTLHVLNRALDELPARDRAALLVDTEDVAAEDVAASLGEPIEEFRRRLHRARMVLRQRLTDYFAAATAPH